MAGHCFLSYSSVDGLEFALRLRDALEAGPPSIGLWFDKRDLQAGLDWDEQLAGAIRDAEGVLFVMTLDSVTPNSVCKKEWTRALKYKKPVIPLLVHPTAEMPFSLEPRQYIDFTGSFDAGLARLRQRLEWQRSPAGIVQALRDRVEDARRDAAREMDAAKQARAVEDLRQFQQQLAEQERAVKDPAAAAQRVAASIAAGIERERQPAPAAAKVRHGRFLNPPPLVAPTYFQDRTVETKLLAEFLKDEARRLVMVIGRGGIGKTAMVCRLLKAVEGGALPDDLGPLAVDGIVYLSTRGARRLNATNLYSDLLKLLPSETARPLDMLLRHPQASMRTKFGEMLAAFSVQRVVVLLDNLEDMVDPGNFDLQDGELDDALRAVLEAPPHSIKLIITSRIAPRALALVQPGRQIRLDLDEGLESPHAEQLLRDMDVDGKVGLRGAPVPLLAEARARTRGYPRALEALFAILSADRDTSLAELLHEQTTPAGARSRLQLPENVVEALVGEAFARLDPAAEHVMQALAVYGHRVTPTAVDYLLQPFQLGVDSEPVLKRLTNMHLVRKERDRYYLHPVDSAYAFERVPVGTSADRDVSPPPFTRIALTHRAADYFVEVRTSSDTWRTIDDVSAQLSEFELRCAVEEYDAAVHVLLQIDDQLQLWGYYSTQLTLWERLVGHLGHAVLEATAQNQLGQVRFRMGHYDRALEHFTSGLGTGLAAENLSCVSASLSGLAHCHGDLGRTALAIEHYKRGLEIARQSGDRQHEAADLGNIGFFTAELGDTRGAIDYHQRAMAIYEQCDDPDGLTISRGNLGAQHAELGDHDAALAQCTQALTAARAINYRYSEAVNLTYLADILADREDWAKAIEHYQLARDVAGTIGNAQFAVTALHGMALAYVASGRLPEARAAIDEAQTYNVPRSNGHVHALSGIIRLAQGEAAANQFTASVASAEEILTGTPRHGKAWDAKALALAGLTLCGGIDRVDGCIAAYREARAINREPGVVGRVLRLFDLLARSDAAGVLTAARPAAAGV